MFATQANEVASTPPPPLPTTALQDGDPEVRASVKILPEQVRHIIRLIQCPQCSYPLRDPITLPCGRSLCRPCLPETHLRTNISYPGTTSRSQGFQCPFAECAKSHAVGDCAVDVTLSKALELVRTEFERYQTETTAFTVTVQVTAPDQWAVAGITSLQEKEVQLPQSLPGCRLSATYRLAEYGQLDYGSQITYTERAESGPGLEDNEKDLIMRIETAMRSDMDCQVCYALYYDPLTTPCGHTFCRHCLRRVFDHALNCPICRRLLYVEPQLEQQSAPSNRLLGDIISMFWTEAVMARKQFVAAEGDLVPGSIPIFICTLSFPSMPTFLHVFEPRYRLMIRRALEGDRMFGMVLYKRPRQGSDRNFEDLGTVLRIVNAEFLPDGRSLLETIGVSRFRILSHSTVDGYIVAETEKIHDISMSEEEELEAQETLLMQGVQDFTSGERSHTPPETPDAPFHPASAADLDSMATRELMNFAQAFVDRMRGQSVDWLATRMLAIYGQQPDDPAKFPWWFASILPVRDEEKYRLLATNSVRERLKVCCTWILEWSNTR